MNGDERQNERDRGEQRKSLENRQPLQTETHLSLRFPTLLYSVWLAYAPLRRRHGKHAEIGMAPAELRTYIPIVGIEGTEMRLLDRIAGCPEGATVEHLVALGHDLAEVEGLVEAGLVRKHLAKHHFSWRKTPLVVPWVHLTKTGADWLEFNGGKQ